MLDGVARLPEARAALVTFAQARADFAAAPGAGLSPATLPRRAGHFQRRD